MSVFCSLMWCRWCDVVAERVMSVAFLETQRHNFLSEWDNDIWRVMICMIHLVSKVLLTLSLKVFPCTCASPTLCICHVLHCVLHIYTTHVLHVLNVLYIVHVPHLHRVLIIFYIMYYIIMLYYTCTKCTTIDQEIFTKEMFTHLIFAAWPSGQAIEKFSCI